MPPRSWRGSSVGRAAAWKAVCHQFKSGSRHHKYIKSLPEMGVIFLLWFEEKILYFRSFLYCAKRVIYLYFSEGFFYLSCFCFAYFILSHSTPDLKTWYLSLAFDEYEAFSSQFGNNSVFTGIPFLMNDSSMSFRRKAVVLNDEWNRKATFLSFDHCICLMCTPFSFASNHIVQVGRYFPSFSLWYRTTRAYWPSRSIFEEKVESQNSPEAGCSHQRISTISRVLSITGQVLLCGTTTNSLKSGIWRWSSGCIVFLFLELYHIVLYQ